MPFVASVETHLPCWGSCLWWGAGGDEDKWEAPAMAWDYPRSQVVPSDSAPHVRRYLHESPATEEHLAMVAVKYHCHGANNPKARLRYEITMEQALNAPTVVTPFRRYACAPECALAHNIGGPTAVSAVTISERPGGSH